MAMANLDDILEMLRIAHEVFPVEGYKGPHVRHSFTIEQDQLGLNIWYAWDGNPEDIRNWSLYFDDEPVTDWRAELEKARADMDRNCRETVERERAEGTVSVYLPPTCPRCDDEG
jgi:hypothetical protein